MPEEAGAAFYLYPYGALSAPLVEAAPDRVENAVALKTEEEQRHWCMLGELAAHILSVKEVDKTPTEDAAEAAVEEAHVPIDEA